MSYLNLLNLLIIFCSDEFRLSCLFMQNYFHFYYLFWNSTLFKFFIYVLRFSCFFNCFFRFFFLFQQEVILTWQFITCLSSIDPYTSLSFAWYCQFNASEPAINFFPFYSCHLQFFYPQQAHQLSISSSIDLFDALVLIFI